MVARTGSCVSGAPSIWQRNMAFGKLSITTASISMTSSFGLRTRSVLFLRSLPWARASFLPKSAVVDGDDDCCAWAVSTKEARDGDMGDADEGAGTVNAWTLLLLWHMHKTAQMLAMRMWRIMVVGWGKCM